MRLTGDYGDTFGLTEDDVIPKIKPTEDFIVQLANLACQKLEADKKWFQGHRVTGTLLCYQKVGIIPQERTDTKDTKAWRPHRL